MFQCVFDIFHNVAVQISSSLERGSNFGGFNGKIPDGFRNTKSSPSARFIYILLNLESLLETQVVHLTDSSDWQDQHIVDCKASKSKPYYQKDHGPLHVTRCGTVPL